MYALGCNNNSFIFNLIAVLLLTRLITSIKMYISQCDSIEIIQKNLFDHNTNRRITINVFIIVYKYIYFMEY